MDLNTLLALVLVAFSINIFLQVVMVAVVFWFVVRDHRYSELVKQVLVTAQRASEIIEIVSISLNTLNGTVKQTVLLSDIKKSIEKTIRELGLGSNGGMEIRDSNLYLRDLTGRDKSSGRDTVESGNKSSQAYAKSTNPPRPDSTAESINSDENSGVD